MLESAQFSFHGGDADRHIIEARYLGSSLVGLDKTVNAGLVLLTKGRPPKRGERFGFYIAARAPTAGSVEVPTELQEVAWALPLLQDFILLRGQEYVQTLLAFLLSWHGGRKAEGVEQMEKMIEMLQEVNRSKEVEGDQWRAWSLSMVEALRPSAQQIVAPVGRSADILRIQSDRIEPATVDEPMADAIRSKEELVVEDMERMTFRIDGITKHTRQMKIEFLDAPGQYVSADVRDPAFEAEHNPYTDAFAANRPVTVDARRATHNGSLRKLYVMNFISA